VPEYSQTLTSLLYSLRIWRSVSGVKRAMAFAAVRVLSSAWKIVLMKSARVEHLLPRGLQLWLLSSFSHLRDRRSDML
jgi:hypothetical protein